MTKRNNVRSATSLCVPAILLALAGCVADAGETDTLVDVEYLASFDEELDARARLALTPAGLDLDAIRTDVLGASDEERAAIEAQLEGALPEAELPEGLPSRPRERVDERIRVGIPESAEDTLLACIFEDTVTSNFDTGTGGANRFTGIIDIESHVGGGGDDQKAAWIRHTLPSSGAQTTVTANVRTISGSNEAWSWPGFGYASSGVKLRLIVRDTGTNAVRCSDQWVIRENYVPGGHAGGDVPRGAFSLDCTYVPRAGDSGTVTAELRAETWATAGGVAGAGASIRVDLSSLSSRRCTEWFPTPIWP